MHPHKSCYHRKCFLSLGYLLDDRQQQLGNQRTPDLGSDGILVFTIEVVQLEVLLHFLKQKLYAPAFFVQESNFLSSNLKVIGQKFIIPVLFILVTDLSQTKMLRDLGLLLPGIVHPFSSRPLLGCDLRP